MSHFDILEEDPNSSPSQVVRVYLEETLEYLSSLDPWESGKPPPCFWSEKDVEFYRWATRDLVVDPSSFQLGLLVGLALGQRDAGVAMGKKRSRLKWIIARQIWFGMSEEERESVLAKEVWGMVRERFRKMGDSDEMALEKAGTVRSFEVQWTGMVKKWQKEIQQRKVALP